MAAHALHDVAEYLRDEGVAEGAVFINQLAEDCPRGVLVIPPMQGFPVDPDIPNLYKGSFDVIARSGDPEEARDMLTQQVLPLLTIARETWANFSINYCRPLNTPQVFPRSDAGFYEAMISFQWSFVDARM